MLFRSAVTAVDAEVKWPQPERPAQANRLAWAHRLFWKRLPPAYPASAYRRASPRCRALALRPERVPAQPPVPPELQGLVWRLVQHRERGGLAALLQLQARTRGLQAACLVLCGLRDRHPPKRRCARRTQTRVDARPT